MPAERSASRCGNLWAEEISDQGNMPIALIRLAVTREQVTRDMEISWKFYGKLPDK